MALELRSLVILLLLSLAVPIILLLLLELLVRPYPTLPCSERSPGMETERIRVRFNEILCETCGFEPGCESVGVDRDQRVA